MRGNSHWAALAILAASFQGMLCSAANWPQWRGPLGNGVAPDVSPPVAWSETNGVVWKVAIPGQGNASPIVWNDRVFVLTAVETDRKTAPDSPDEDAKLQTWQRDMRVRAGAVHRFETLAYSLKDGSLIWRHVAAEAPPPHPRHKDGSWASGSPVTDGEFLFAYFGSMGLHAYDLDGNLKWKRELGVMRTKNHFGEGSSPAVHGDFVVVVWDHEDDSFIVTMDRKTGEERWRSRREEVTAWATPTVVSAGGKQQVLTSATGKIRSYELASGTVLWETAGMVTNVVPTPAVVGGVAFFASGFRTMAALMAVDLGKATRTGADIGGTDAILWKADRNTPYVPTTLVYAGCVYMLKLNEPLLTCLDAASGKVHFGPVKVEGLTTVYSSPVAAEGRVYVTGRNGATVVLKAGPVFEVLATNMLSDAFTASPAIAGDRLILRGKNLYCLSTGIRK